MRNEPAELAAIGAVLAELRGETAEALAAATTRNAIDSLPGLATLVGAGVRG
jgi:TatD DNase family protein